MSQGPETLIERQITEILKKTEFGDANTAHTQCSPQSYTDRLDDEIRNWRSRLILPSGALAAAATAIVVSRYFSLELTSITTFADFLIGLGLGEAAAIGIGHLRVKNPKNYG